ncbi:hypothetical protein Tco_1501815 [Tanacetum coccineum]
MAEQNVPTQPPTRTDEHSLPQQMFLLSTCNSSGKQCHITRRLGFIVVKLMNNGVDLVLIFSETWKSRLLCQPNSPILSLLSVGDTVIDFVNELGYPEPVEIVSSIRVNYVYQPWRAILSLLNQCLTGKTSGSDKPRHPVLQMLWGIVTQTNVDHAELIWEEFTQGIQTFFSHKASLKNPKKKVTPLLIPYGRLSLKGDSVEVFGMAIPISDNWPFNNPLIILSIWKWVAENTKENPSGKVQACKLQQSVATQKSPQTTTPVKQIEAISFSDQENLPSVSFHRKLERESPLSNLLTKMMKLKKNLFLTKKDKSETENRLLLKGDRKIKVKDWSIVNLSRSCEACLVENQNSGKLPVSLAGTKPEHMDDEFLVTAYLKVHENLKIITDERVIDDKPESHYASMSHLLSRHYLVHSSTNQLEGDTITTSLLKSLIHRPSVKSARLSRDSEVKKTDHSVDVLASIRS